MRALGGEPINGLLAIHKPLGMVSKDVSRWLTKRVGPLKLGHAGTLDPAASGVLPILLGRVTRLQDYLMELPKTYEFEVEFGQETSTLDSEGEVIHRGSYSHLDEKCLREALEAFKGTISQIPPRYSAVKYQGKPLYQYARQESHNRSAVVGLDEAIIKNLKRTVEVYSYSLLRWEPPRGFFRVHCSKGTYVRCLARDLARSVGTFGSVTQLIRTYASGLPLEQCLTLEEIEERCGTSTSDVIDPRLLFRSNLSKLVLPLDSLEFGVPRWAPIDQQMILRLTQGQHVMVGWDQFRNELSDQGSVSLKDRGFKEKCFEGITPVIVLTDNGRTIGIANAMAHQGGQVTLKLKRGL